MPESLSPVNGTVVYEFYVNRTPLIPFLYLDNLQCNNIIKYNKTTEEL